MDLYWFEFEKACRVENNKIRRFLHKSPVTGLRSSLPFERRFKTHPATKVFPNSRESEMLNEKNETYEIQGSTVKSGRVFFWKVLGAESSQISRLIENHN